MKKYLFAVVTIMIVGILSACASSSQNPLVEEQVKTDEASPTDLPAFPDLASVLIQEGDLPAGYSAGTTDHKFPTYYAKLFIPEADYVIRQQIKRDSVSGGQVIVFEYTAAGLATLAFDSITDDMKRVRPLEGVGEKGMLETPSDDQSGSQEYVGIVFVQCHALVHISILGTNDEQSVIAYAEGLSQRLEPLVCDN